MTILHEEHKPKATPMTSDAVREMLIEAVRDSSDHDTGINAWDAVDAVLSALSDAKLAVLPLEADRYMRAAGQWELTDDNTTTSLCVKANAIAGKLWSQMARKFLENKDE